MGRKPREATAGGGAQSRYKNAPVWGIVGRGGGGGEGDG